jgi:mono/diheme cytochrome c family protein
MQQHYLRFGTSALPACAGVRGDAGPRSTLTRNGSKPRKISNARAIVAAALTLLAGTACSAETLVERGGYLVNGVMACAGCHTPRGPNGPLLDKQFSGGSVVFDQPTYTVRGSNITLDADTGIGSWSDAQVKRALTDGIRPDGRRLAPIMPSTSATAWSAMRVPLRASTTSRAGWAVAAT